MGLGGILQELKTEGVLALYHDYRSGRLYDWSGNGRNGVITNGYFDKKSSLLRYVTGEIRVTYDVGLVSSSISMIIGINFPFFTSGDRIVTRRTASSTFDWYINPPNSSIFQDGLVKSLALSNFTKCLGVSMPNGVAFSGYYDGIYAGTYTGTTNLVATTADLVIGNLSASNACLTNKTVSYFVYVTRSLTATEHARLYGQLESMRWNTKGLTPGPMIP